MEFYPVNQLNKAEFAEEKKRLIGKMLIFRLGMKLHLQTKYLSIV